MTFLFVISALILLLATLMPLSTGRYWWLRAMDFPRLQIACICLCWLLAAFFFARPFDAIQSIAAVTVCLILIYQCYWIWPYTPWHKVDVQPAPQALNNAVKRLPEIKLISSNVLMTNRNAAALIQLVEQHEPDIVITLESDQWWQDQLDPALSGYSYRLACPLDNLYGMHVYSQRPLQHATTEFLVESDKPSMRMMVKLNDTAQCLLHVVHPAPPAPGENKESTERDVELIMLARELSGDTDPVIVAGDLNDVAWSATTRLFKQISGLLDPRVGRGLFNTFNCNYRFVRWPLDHVFISHHFRLVDLQRLPSIGSDHYPLLAHLALSTVNTDDRDTSSNDDSEESDIDRERLNSILDSEVAHQAQSPSDPRNDG